ncbi:MAG TPA: hypothetical protein VLT47_05385 [Anaeromyxobacteraceae bacterium]|nr:hypothetical protein [Anaeromyxobacteraceae bacterium]
MKRIALLLAAVAGLGTGAGCTVSTGSACDPQSLTIDWRFIDANGNSGLGCGAAGVSDLDVYIDGARVVTAAPCDPAMALQIVSPPNGVHRVVLEGYDSLGNFINRDWADLPIATCGDTYWQASPGSGWLEFQPTGCSANNGNLLYSLRDVTRSPTGEVIDQIDSTLSLSTIATYTCQGGIYYTAAMPYGDYELVDLEEVKGDLSMTYSSHCAAIPARVDFYSPTSYNPDLTVYSPAMTVLGPSCGL